VGVDPVGSLLYHHFHTGQLSEAHGYKIEGIGEDFLPSTYDHTVLDDMIQVADKESFLMTRRLVREEGIFCGISCGSAVVGALKYARQEKLGKDKQVVVLLPDSGSRYLSKVFNDDWMRENQMLDPAWMGATVGTLLSGRTRQNLVVAHCDESVRAMVGKMREYGISQIPVIDDDNELLGLVREVSLLNFMLTEGADKADTAIKHASVIDSDVVTVSPNTALESLMGTFNTSDVAIVKDNSDIQDIVTKIDLIDFLAHVKA
jgi:cystathionine beta-synthase